MKYVKIQMKMRVLEKAGNSLIPKITPYLFIK